MRTHLAISAAVCILSSGAQAQVTLQAVTVGTHSQTTPLADSVYDTAFTQASSALNNDVGSNDVDCNVGMARYGAQVTYTEGDDNISDDVEYYDTTFRNNGTFMNVVDSINWCEVTGSAGGCGYPINGGTPFVITRAWALDPANGLAFAHEFGHVLGNTHDDDQPLQIMDPDGPTTSHTKVRTSTRCAMFREDIGCWNPGGCSLYALSFTAGEPPQRESQQRVDQFWEASSTASAQDKQSTHASRYADLSIEELGSRLILDRIPVEVDEYYGQKDVEVLKQMLADPARITYHNTILTLIGLISDGNAGDVHALTDYIMFTQNSAQKYAAAMALGYIVNRANSAEALAFLLTQRHSSDRAVARGSILGLGLSGNIRARAELEDAVSVTVVQDRGRNILNHALTDNLLIEELGLKGYYQRGRTR